MSNKSQDIQGNLNISRNITIGSHGNIEGNLVIGHNLVVKGWVDAPNIKGPLKGLYKDETKLKAAYPRPMPGWFALVGDTLPAEVYRAEHTEKGMIEWVATGQTSGEFKIWLDPIEERLEEIARTQGSLEDKLKELQDLLKELEDFGSDDGSDDGGGSDSGSLASLKTSLANHIRNTSSVFNAMVQRQPSASTFHVSTIHIYSMEDLDKFVTPGVYRIDKLPDSADYGDDPADISADDVEGRQEPLLIVSQGRIGAPGEDGSYDVPISQLLLDGDGTLKFRTGVKPNPNPDDTVTWTDWGKMVVADGRGNIKVSKVTCGDLDVGAIATFHDETVFKDSATFEGTTTVENLEINGEVSGLAIPEPEAMTDAEVDALFG